APLASTSQTSGALPSGRLSPDAVILDIAFVRLKATDQGSYQAIWGAADEQRLYADVREALKKNGVRAGVFGQQFPPQLRELIDTPPKLLAELSQGQPDDLDLHGSRQRLPLRAGHRSVIKASKVFPSLPVLLSEEGTVRGSQLPDPGCTHPLQVHTRE